MKYKELKAPFPYFGGKSTIALEVWKRFGKVNNYIEPFCGTLAVLLKRPLPSGYETVNDKSCMISNFWRAVKLAPEEVIHHCQHPVSEVDLHSRHSWLQFKGKPELKEKLLEDPEYFDAKIAGWWVWGMCLWIGGGWCSDQGLTTRGRIVLKRPKMRNSGIVTQQRRPELKNNHGIITHFQKPNVKFTGIAGVKKTIPSLERKGIQRNLSVEEWIQSLCDRLSDVRICCGDWKRVCDSDSVTTKLGETAIFLDPPYGEETERDMRLYSEESGTVAEDVRKWCISRGANKKIKIALCGYDGEHDELLQHDWQVYSWTANGGYGNRSQSQNRKKERIWFSPSCKRPENDLFQGNLF